MVDRCIPCEQHAELHRGNVLGFGPQNEPCQQCEEHARMHSDGCGGLFMVLMASVAVVGAAIGSRRNRA